MESDFSNNTERIAELIQPEDIDHTDLYSIILTIRERARALT